MRLIYALLAVWALLVAGTFANQSRFEQMGAKPCKYGVCVLVWDKRVNDYFWQALPPAPDPDIIPKIPG